MGREKEKYRKTATRSTGVSWSWVATANSAMEALEAACSAGDLAAARAALPTTTVAVAEALDTAFRIACSNGHVAIARWLHDDVGACAP